MYARVYVCVCGRRFGIAVLADVRYILRISIRNIIHVCRTPIHFHSVYSPSYIYMCGEGWGEENGGVDERKRNKGMTVEWHGENTDFELHTHTYIYIYKFVWICLSLSHR